MASSKKKVAPKKPSTAIVRKDLKREQTDASKALAQAKSMSIDSTADLEFAAAVLAEVKGHNNRLEEMKKRVTKPMNDALNEVRSWFKPVQDHYFEIERAIKLKIGEYQNRLEMERRAALEAAERAVASGTRAEVENAIARVNEAEQPNIASFKTRKVWTFEVTDPTAVPREFCTPDPKKLRAYAIEAREHASCPGVRFYQETIVASDAT